MSLDLSFDVSWIKENDLVEVRVRLVCEVVGVDAKNGPMRPHEAMSDPPRSLSTKLLLGREKTNKHIK